jgi:hypothetical protein
MDELNEPRSKFSLGRLFANCLTLLILLATVGIGVAFAIVYINPQVPFNPYPPPTLPALLEFPTSPPTEEPTDTPTNTATATSEPEATATTTAVVTATAVTSTPESPTETPTPVPPTETPTTTPVPFTLQAGSVAATTSWFHGCDWMGVGGHVLDTDNSPLVGYVIQLGGELAGEPMNMEVLSGSASEILGTSGYLFDLADHPVASEETLWLQLVDASSGLPLSEQVLLTTYDTCSKNLLLVNWSRLP